MNHPAKYTKSLLPIFDSILKEYGCNLVLDCFAGTGKIHSLNFKTIGVEIEHEWAKLNKKTVVGDSTKLCFKNGMFDAVCTSPTYGNRMADSHNAKDGSKRNTYTHTLGKRLIKNNSGAMQWGAKYKKLHCEVWVACFDVIKNNGVLILNFKNHIRNGVEIDAFGWHCKQLISTGFYLRSVQQINVTGNQFGTNSKLRVPFEYVAVFQKKVKSGRKNENIETG